MTGDTVDGSRLRGRYPVDEQSRDRLNECPESCP